MLARQTERTLKSRSNQLLMQVSVTPTAGGTAEGAAEGAAGGNEEENFM